jgi:hypothetical protein
MTTFREQIEKHMQARGVADAGKALDAIEQFCLEKHARLDLNYHRVADKSPPVPWSEARLP